MALNDFARRLLGYDPFGDNSGQPVTAPQANAAALAQPTLEQSYQDDLQQAQMSKLGQLGMLLMASGQQLTPAQRATILAQAPAYMDGAQKDAMTAAQARLYGMTTKAKQDEIAQHDALRQQAPALAKSLGISPELSGALSPEQIREMYIKKQMADPRESQLMDLKIQEEQAIIAALNAPKPMEGTIIEMADGSKALLPKGTTTPMPIPGTGQAPKPPTKEQSDAFGFATRMARDMPVLQDPQKIEAGSSTFNRAVSNVPFGYGNQWAGKDYQQFTQAQRDFINAVLRRESGAAIGKEEFENANLQYFPQPGDTPETVQQKLTNQNTQLEAIMYGMAPADRQRLMEEMKSQKTRLPAGVRSITEVK